MSCHNCVKVKTVNLICICGHLCYTINLTFSLFFTEDTEDSFSGIITDCNIYIVKGLVTDKWVLSFWIFQNKISKNKFIAHMDSIKEDKDHLFIAKTIV